MKYDEFISRKIKKHSDVGIDIDIDKLNIDLFDYQKDIVKRSLNAGKYAIFADCGLGKSFMQLEWSRHVVDNTDKKVLIIAPLAVVKQTINESEKFGIDLKGIKIINYEQIHKIDVSELSGIVLDESSILKNFDGKTRKLIIEKFKDIPYKLACTATPSPNDPMELGNHAEFLDIMSYQQMLSMFFIHDGGNTQKWRLKGHAEDIFWKWISNWSCMINKPSDIGYSDDNYKLPELIIHEKRVIVPKKDNGMLFNSTSVNATDYNKELRITKELRVDETQRIVNSSDESFIIWVKQNEEADAIKKLIPGSIEVRGNEKPEIKTQKLMDFANNKYRVLITKTKIAQFGLNFQNCHNMIFMSPDFSFESTYQAVRREYRFGQSNNVNVWFMIPDTMQNISDIFKRKQEQFKIMQNKMIKFFNKGEDVEMKNNNPIKEEIENENYRLLKGDSCKIIDEIKDESIGFSIFSPPFADLYTYSDSVEDMGNSTDYKEFIAHFDYLIEKLAKKMMSGRNVAVHCCDLPIQKGKEGYIGLRDFSGMILDVFLKHGFVYHSRVTLWKDPVVEMQRTKALGLLHKQVKKDSVMSRVGIPDYLMIFRSPGENKNPIESNDIPVDLWQKYASPVWMDINYSNTLQHRNARDHKDEKHICPLQLETIERAIHLWSNKGDTVFTPFMGISSEVYQAVKMDRYGVGIELKDSYFEQAKKNMDRLMLEKSQGELFTV